MTEAIIPEQVQHLLVQLEYLALLEKNLKPNMSDMTFSDGNSFFHSLWRTFHREGGEKNMVFLEEIVKTALQMLDETKDESWRPLLVNSLTRARDGIRNLLITYDSRPKIKARVAVLVSMIDLKLIPLSRERLVCERRFQE